MDKPGDNETLYMIKDNTENTDNLQNDTDTAKKINNGNNINGIKKKEEDTTTRYNTESRGLEVNRSSSMPEGINNTITKHSWAEEAGEIDILGEILKEDTKKSKIIENLIKEKGKWEAELREKNKIIKNLITEKHKGNKEEINIETSCSKGHHIKNIKTRVNKIKWQLDIKNSEMRDISDKIGDLLSELEKMEKLEGSLEYNGIEENKFQEQATQNIDIYKVSSRNNEIIDSNYQNNSKTQSGGNYNWRKLPCRIHGIGHTAEECETTCGFCLTRGSHQGDNCRKKNEKIDQFVYICIQKFGITAKATAESFIKADGIYRPTQEEFERKLRDSTRILGE